MAIGELGASLGATENPDKFEHIQYDAVSYAGMRLAYEATFGKILFLRMISQKQKQLLVLVQIS